MKKFIETEMGKIKGKDLEAEQESEGTKYLSPEDAALQVFSSLILSPSSSFIIHHWCFVLLHWTITVLYPFDTKDIQALPEHLKKSTFKKDQQMLSAQMLAGIPEVRPDVET